MKRIVNTNIRFDRNREDDRQAYEYLRNMDRTKYKSYTRAVVAALNDFFSRRERIQADPFLETREKEDAFLRRVLDTIKVGMQNSGAGSLGALVALLQNTQSATSPDAAPMTNEEFDTAMDFINSL